MIERPAGRVVLLDEHNRILLCQAEDPSFDIPSLWITPGGGLEEGESYEEGALRELAEETGLTNVVLGPWIWTRDHTFRYGPIWFHTIERFYLVRTKNFEIQTSGLEPLELQTMTAYRWWSAVELFAAPEARFAPRRIAEFLRSLVEGRIPREPFDVGE